MREAFKEWRVICDALADGRQSIVLRKGGVSESAGIFRLEHREFLLFPTYLHQARDGLVPSEWPRLTQADPAPVGQTILTHGARVVAAAKVISRESLAALRPLHFWSNEMVWERFERWSISAVHVLLLRVYELPAAQTIPLSESYGGCKSWVELEQDIPVAGSRPVLGETEFEAIRTTFLEMTGRDEAIPLPAAENPFA